MALPLPAQQTALPALRSTPYAALACILQSSTVCRHRAWPYRTIEEIEMDKLTIKDLPVATELDAHRMAGVLGGMGRTPQQILAFELTGKPATWQGLVLEDDNQLHGPVIWNGAAGSASRTGYDNSLLS
jgi:hypothetical protein